MGANFIGRADASGLFDDLVFEPFEPVLPMPPVGCALAPLFVEDAGQHELIWIIAVGVRATP